MAQNSGSSSSSSGGIGILGMLGVLFIGLKLTGYIEWSWWWVLDPFWIPVAVFFAICLMIFVVLLIIYLQKYG